MFLPKICDVESIDTLCSFIIISSRSLLLIWIESLGQQSEQGDPDNPPSSHFQYTKAFRATLAILSLQQDLDLLQGLLLDGRAQNTSLIKQSNQMIRPPRMPLLDVEK